MSHTSAIGWILLIWSMSSILALPNAIYSTLVEERLGNDNIAVTCTMIWPDGRYPTSSYDHIYNIIILVVTYLVPISTMAILYYKVGKKLWFVKKIGEDIDDSQDRIILAKRKKIVKMMIVVVIIFALCWLPYHAFFVINYYIPTIFQDSPLNYQRCYLFMYWLAMSNSMYNPIIIYFMNSKFRHEFRKILLLLFCCRTYAPPAKKPATTCYANHHSGSEPPAKAKNSIGAGRRDRTARFGSQSTVDSAQETTTTLNQNNEHSSMMTMAAGADSDSYAANKSISDRRQQLDSRRSAAAAGRAPSIMEEEEEQEPFISAAAANGNLTAAKIKSANNDDDLNLAAGKRLDLQKQHEHLQQAANSKSKSGGGNNSNGRVWI